MTSSLVVLFAAAALNAPVVIADGDHAKPPTVPQKATDHCPHCDAPAKATTEAETCPHCGDKAKAGHEDCTCKHGKHDAHAAPKKHDGHGKHDDHKGHKAPAANDRHAEHSQHGSHGGKTAMTGVLGPYAMTREASGTSWQPDATPHHMSHDMWGEWAFSAHAQLNLVYDWQDGPRGDEKTFVAGMAMVSARRSFGEDVLNLRAMLSPDALMGKRGYPLLLAAGETADGVTHLVDRQHPHDLFMELSASYSFSLGKDEALFLYAGLPGEPAFGPPAFMHRLSAMQSPEAPISHHWLDSTHIAFGVLTAGWVKDAWKVEVSAFKGREPDEHRFDIESPNLDSVAARVSFNPTENWSLQVSWADQDSVEQLEPLVDETKLSASAIYTVALADEGWWSTTLAWGWKDPSEGDTTNAVALETAYAPNRDWTLFARGEITENPELGPTTETVGKISFGAVRDFHVAENTALGIGALYSVNFIPNTLEPSYGGDPDGAMVFVRLTTSN